MTDIQEVSPDFQKLNKSEHCIILHMKNDTKIAITSPVCTKNSHYVTGLHVYLCVFLLVNNRFY